MVSNFGALETDFSSAISLSNNSYLCRELQNYDFTAQIQIGMSS